MDKAFWDDSLATIKTHPIRYAKKTIKETVKFWHVFDDHNRFVGSYAFLLPLGIFGLVLFARKRMWSELALYSLPLLCAWFLGAAVNASHRFRLPFEPALLAFVGLFFDRLFGLSGRRRVLAIAAVALFGAAVFSVSMYPSALKDFVRAVSNWLGFSNYPVY